MIICNKQDHEAVRKPYGAADHFLDNYVHFCCEFASTIFQDHRQTTHDDRTISHLVTLGRPVNQVIILPCECPIYIRQLSDEKVKRKQLILHDPKNENSGNYSSFIMI